MSELLILFPATVLRLFLWALTKTQWNRSRPFLVFLAEDGRRAFQSVIIVACKHQRSTILEAFIDNLSSICWFSGIITLNNYADRRGEHWYNYLSLRSRRFLSIFQEGRSSKRANKWARLRWGKHGERWGEREWGTGWGRKANFILCPTPSPAQVLRRKM